MKTWIRLAGLVYWVDEFGNIDKRRGQGYLKPFPDKDGYLKVVVYIKGKSNNFLVHRIVYEAFFGQIPDGMSIDHVDGNKVNNHISNLQLLTPEENAVKGNAKNWDMISPSGEWFTIYNMNAFCKERNLNPNRMRDVAKGKPFYNQHKGWRKYYG